MYLFDANMWCRGLRLLDAFATNVSILKWTDTIKKVEYIHTYKCVYAT